MPSLFSVSLGAKHDPVLDFMQNLENHDALYSPFGREAVPPEGLLRELLLQAFYSIRSERRLVERIDNDLLFRWFVGLGIEDAAVLSHDQVRDTADTRKK
jgi:transposase